MQLWLQDALASPSVGNRSPDNTNSKRVLQAAQVNQKIDESVRQRAKQLEHN